jgi:hypothetical protein
VKSISQIVSSGRSALEAGELGVAKGYALELSQYLDVFVPSELEANLIDLYLKEILLIQQVSKWKEADAPEYKLLKELADKCAYGQGDIKETLDRFFG